MIDITEIAMNDDRIAPTFFRNYGDQYNYILGHPKPYYQAFGLIEPKIIRISSLINNTVGLAKFAPAYNREYGWYWERWSIVLYQRERRGQL